jgi:hypothetical protein
MFEQSCVAPLVTRCVLDLSVLGPIFKVKEIKDISILDDGQSLCRHLMLWRWGIPNVEIYARV